MTPAVEPGDESFDAVAERLSSILRESNQNLQDIREMSNVSFRRWLEKVTVDIAESLGIALAKAQAFLADVLTIAANAGSTFLDAYRKGYSEARQVHRRGRKR